MKTREQAQAEGLTNARFEQGDAQVYPFETGTYDLALSRFGAMFFVDPVAAFQNIARALRPGGRLVVLTTRRPRLPLVGPGLGALSQVTGIRMWDPGLLTESLAAEGFTAIRRRSYGFMQCAGATLG